MLRYGVSASSNQGLHSQPRRIILVVAPSRLCSPLSSSAVRFQTSGQPLAQKEDQQRNESSSNESAQSSSSPYSRGRPEFRRPDFLQTLKVEKNPISGQAMSNFRNSPYSKDSTRSKKTFESSKLNYLLRKGPEGYGNVNLQRTATLHPRSNQPFPPLISATQSNLNNGGSASVKPAQKDLLQFFQKRLDEVKNSAQVAPGTASDKPYNQQPRPPAQRIGSSRQPPKLNWQQQGLRGAMTEARVAVQTHVAEKQKPKVPYPYVGLSPIREVLESTRMTGNTILNKEHRAKKIETTTSPIRQFILDLKKKQRLEQEANANASLVHNSTEEMKVPSWRTSARVISQNQRFQPEMVDPLFPHQSNQRSQTTYEDLMVVNNLYQSFFEDDKPKSPKVVKPKEPKEIVLPWTDVSLRELSSLLGKKVDQIVKCLQELGESPEDEDSYKIDADLAEIVALQLDVKFTRPKRRPKVQTNDHEQLMERRKASELSTEESNDTESAELKPLAPRPPVVCIMGHVDHGKTTLMDALRRRSSGSTTSSSKKKTKKGNKVAKKEPSGDVAGTEAGGITQIISAFQVPLADQKESITFLDTPGHAAFSAMRQSGSHAADIIVLVIAADDGVSPQTIEILNFYKSIVKESDGGISMVVAMNKIDKSGIDVEDSRRRIENQLLEHGIVPEGVTTHSESEYGSPVQFVPISAKTGEGLDDLIEGLALQSEVMDLRADDKTRAEGIVMDARVEQGLGVVVDCIVRWGSIQPGDVVVSGTNMGKVRILKDVNDKTLKKGSPSQPIRVVGFKTTPKAGDPFMCVASEQVADDLVQRRLAHQSKLLSSHADEGNSNFSQVIISGRESMTSIGTERKLGKYDLSLENTGPIRIPIIVKAKADGSVAAVRDSLKMLGKESSFDLDIDIIAQGVGPLTTSEIEMAKESNAVVFCFDIRNQHKHVLAEAEASGVSIHEYDVIYSLLDDAKDIFTEEYLPPKAFETVHGKAIVQEVFSISGGKEVIAGLKVLDGYLHKSKVTADNSPSAQVYFRVIRNGERISPNGETVRASSLRKFKEDVDAVRHGEECGLGLTNTVDFQKGDIVECYSVEMRKSFT